MTRSPQHVDLSDPSPAGPADWLLAAPGPIAFGLAAVVLTPLALTWTSPAWVGLVVLAGAGLFWWTIMWVGRHVHAPHMVLVLPLAIALVAVLGPPLAAHPAEFFRQPPQPITRGEHVPAWVVDRDSSVVATQKLLVVLLLAAPLYHAIWLGRWTATWFRLALLLGVAALLTLTALQIGRTQAGPPDAFARAELATIAPPPAQHVAAFLAAAIAWLIGIMVKSVERWRLERSEQTAGDWADDLRRPHLMAAILAAIVLVAAVGLALAVCVAGAAPWSPWRVTSPWIGLAFGLLLVVLWRSAFRLIGWGLVAASLTAMAVLWPWHAVAESFTRGGLFGWAGDELHPLEFPGLLTLIEWRGLFGLLAIAAAVAIAVNVQVRRVRRMTSHAQQSAAGGAAVASWMLAGSWLMGPAYVSGPAAFFALSLWALSLGPPAERPSHGPGGYLFFLLAVAVFAYGLLGLTPEVHPPLWLSPGFPYGDKLLHAVWGLYVTLVCCLSMAPFGRAVSVPVGAACSVAMAVAAEYIQKYFLPARAFEWADAALYALAAGVVVVGLLLVPYPWPRWQPDRRGSAGPL